MSAIGNSHDADSDESPLIPSPTRSFPSRSSKSHAWYDRFVSSDLPLYQKLALVVVIAVSSVIFVFFVLNLFKTSSSTKKVCTTPECVLTSARILSSLDTSINPCDDFYRFSCGGWLKKTWMPADKSRIGTFNTLTDNNNRILRDVFERDYTPDTSLSNEDRKKEEELFNKIQTYYKSCLNESVIDQLGITPLTTFLSSEIMPLFKEFDLSKIISISAKYYTKAFFSMEVGADLNEPEKNVISISQSGINLPSIEYYRDDDILKVYQDAIVGMNTQILFLLKGKNYTEHEQVEIAKKVVEFESKIASISKPKVELKDPKKTYNPYKIKGLPDLAFDQSFWKSYFENLFPKSEYGTFVNEESVVIVDNPQFFRNFSKLVKSVDKEVIEYYFIWILTNKFITKISKKERSPTVEYRQKVGLIPSSEPERWETCLSAIDNAMGDVASKWFIKEAFGEESKKAAQETIMNIKKAFLERLPRIEWIDEATRALAIEKVKSLRTKIGYPDFILSPTDALEKYKLLSFLPWVFFKNTVNLVLWNSQDNRQNIKKPVDFSKWEMSASTVNAYYNPPLNELVFPAGILQPPFYSANDPDYLNFGGIGSVVGHELTHAFDNNGRKFDSHGVLKDWWTPQTAAEFEKKAKCFVYEYGNFTVPVSGVDYNVDGTLTLGENLADNGGLQRAFEAWKSNGKTKKLILPGLQEYEEEKLFFVSFAQVWCSKQLDTVTLKRIRTDPHSPENYRVNGAIVNSETFAGVFKCPVGSKMNPKKKCLIW